MYQGGTPGAYGYGQVHREFPQAQQQQGKPPLAAITAPLDAAQPSSWAVLLASWAALNAVTEVVYALAPGLTPDSRELPVAFPKLGQWVPVAEDPRVPWRVVLPRLPPPPPPPLLAHGQWTPTAPPLDAPFYAFRLRLARLTGPAVGPEAWLRGLRDTAALQALRTVVSLVAPQTWATQPPPVRFPRLGQWTPTAEDPRVPVRFILPQIPPPPPPPARARAGQWTPTTPDLDRAYASYRLRLARITAPAALPAIWPLEVENWAALNATLTVVSLVAPPVWATQPPPVRFPRLGQWVPTAEDPRVPVRFRLPQLPPPPPPPALPGIWGPVVATWAALNAAATVLYFVGGRTRAIGGDRVAFPRLGQWLPLPPEPGQPYRVRLPKVAFEVLPGVPSWEALRDGWAAFSATRIDLMLVARAGRVEPSLPIVPAWAAELVRWPALVAPIPFFLAPRAVPAITGVLAGPPPWAVLLETWAALQATWTVTALVRPGGIGILAELPPQPSGGATLRQWAAASALLEVLYLVVPPGRVALPPGPVPPWVVEHALWPALGATLNWVAKVADARPRTTIETGLPPAWKASRDTRAAYERLPDRSLFWQPARYLPFVPIVIDYARLGLVGVTVTNLRANAIPIPPWLGGVVEETDPKLLRPGSLADGENFVPQRAPRLAARGGSRVMLTLKDDAGTPAELSHVLGCAPKAATGAVLIGWSSGTTKHYGYAVTSDMAYAGASEALSRTAFPASWNRATPSRPVVASLFEKLYVADATALYSARNPMAVIDAVVPPAISVPTFAFVAGGNAAQGLFCYCLEEYNNVLFIAGYGDEETGTGDDPALVRHSFLGQAPDAAAGFDKDAYNTIGSKGDRVTAMKKGRGLLVIAKANELYRVTGAGRAYPGWQYQVEGVHNTLGVGVENPLALEHAEGYWFGIGKQGPFRTDGYEVDPLSGPRQRTWASIDQLGQAWVRYHPERRVVLFGVHIVAGAPDATYPWVTLVWDCERSVWQPNWKLAGTPRFFVAQAIATTTAQGPTAGPSAPNNSAVTTSSWSANWTNGDATAETEYWEQQQPSGAWALLAVLAAGVASRNSTGTNHTGYKWRVRHRKNGIYSPYTADLLVQTLISPPSISFLACLPGAVVNVRVTQNSSGTCTVERSPHGLATWTSIGSFSGTSLDIQTSTAFTGGVDIRAKTSDGAWSVPSSTFDQVNGLSCP